MHEHWENQLLAAVTQLHFTLPIKRVNEVKACMQERHGQPQIQTALFGLVISPSLLQMC